MGFGLNATNFFLNTGNWLLRFLGCPMGHHRVPCEGVSVRMSVLGGPAPDGTRDDFGDTNMNGRLPSAETVRLVGRFFQIFLVAALVAGPAVSVMGADDSGALQIAQAKPRVHVLNGE